MDMKQAINIIDSVLNHEFLMMSKKDHRLAENALNKIKQYVNEKEKIKEN